MSKPRSNTFLPASSYLGSSYKKPNELILSLSTPSLVTNKLLMICTMRASKSENGALTASISGSELHKIFGRSTKSGSFYDTIKNACYRSTPGKSHNGSLLDYKAIIEDKENQSFSAHNIVTDAEFNRGILSVTFNPRMEKRIIGMKNNYTCLDPDEMMSMKSIYSYRFLELFKQSIGYQKWAAEEANTRCADGVNRPYCVRCDVTELKLRMNIIDASNAAVFKTLTNKNKSLRDVEAFDQSSTREFSNFRRNVLDVAQKELEEKASIRFEYELIRTGRGGKTSAINFFVYINEKNVKKVEKKTEEDIVDLDDQIDKLRVMIKENLPTKDLRRIVEVANGDIDKIMQIYHIAEESRTDIERLTGFLIDGIRKNYDPIPIKKKGKGSSTWDINGDDDSYQDFFDKFN